jgi:putative SOS response-associated peptidase YedK
VLDQAGSHGALRPVFRDRDDFTAGRKPINARAETASRLPIFRAVYAKRRCIVPVDNFFEGAD